MRRGRLQAKVVKLLLHSLEAHTFLLEQSALSCHALVLGEVCARTVRRALLAESESRDKRALEIASDRLQEVVVDYARNVIDYTLLVRESKG